MIPNFGINVFSRVSNYFSPNPDKTFSSVSTEPLEEGKESNKYAIADWGTSNNFPNEMDEKIKLSDGFETGFQDLTEMTYAMGLTTYKRVFNDVKNKWEIVPWYFPEFDQFVKAYSFNEEFLEKGIYNFFRYANVFVEVVLDKDGKILRLFTQDSPYIRISTLSPNSGRSEYAYSFASWKKYKNVQQATIDNLLKSDKKLMNQFLLIDRKDPINFIKINYKATKTNMMNMMWHFKDYSPGDPYYGKSPWYPVLDNGWLDISKSIPSAIKASYANDMTISKHVEYNQSYFQDKIKNFANLSEPQKEEAIKAFQVSIEKNLTGEANQNKVIFSPFQWKNGTKEPAIIINDIKNNTSNNSIVKDSTHLNSMIKSALRMDDALTGSKNTGSKEADSGSEKKQASNLFQLRVQMLRDKLIYCMEIVKQTNGWDQDMVFGFQSQILVSTDTAKSGAVSTPITSN